MSDRSALLVSIADTIKDYRSGEIAEPTPDHVDRWVQQFTSEAQVPLLAQLDYTLKRTYSTRGAIADFLAALIRNQELAGLAPRDFWAKTQVLDIQKHGHSQREFRKLFGTALIEQCGLALDDCGASGGEYVYIDDVLFTGNRIGEDLSAWIADQAPADSTVHIIVIATHRFGEWKCRERLERVAADAGKRVDLRFWATMRLENRNAKRDISEVLWPVAVPPDPALLAYLAEENRFPFAPRRPGGKLEHAIFSSEKGRQLLEEQFLLAGMRIRSFSKNPSRALRPLGFSPFGLGFGSMIATFRNCPNNAPLALWWGDPEAPAGHPFRNWRPLLPRKTYADEDGVDVTF